MKEERDKQLNKELDIRAAGYEQFNKENYTKIHDYKTKIAYNDPTSNELIGMVSLAEIEKDSDEAKGLEMLGFKLIYRAELSEEKISEMSPIERDLYEEKMKCPLIIDGKEENHSLEFARMVSDHYLSRDLLAKDENYVPTMLQDSKWSLGENYNSIKKYINPSEYKDEKKTSENLQKILSDIGLNSTLDHENITIESDTPYPVVKKSKFEQIYDKSKGKIKEVFAKLKGLVNSKDKTKENDQNER